MGHGVSFTLTVLGSSGMFQTRARACAGYLVEAAGKRIWMDAGPGTWRNLLSHIHYRDVDGVILTHRHPDHTTDLLQAYHARELGQADALPSIPLWAPQETLDRLLAFSEQLNDSFDIHAVKATQTVDIDGAAVSFFEMAHPVETVGVRIEWDGAVLAYSADTGPAADFGGLAGGADLFVCEATFQDADDHWEGHLSASQAASLAAEAGVGELLLTHLPPDRDHDLSLTEARAAATDLPTRLASDGLRVELAR